MNDDDDYVLDLMMNYVICLFDDMNYFDLYCCLNLDESDFDLGANLGCNLMWFVGADDIADIADIAAVVGASEAQIWVRRRTFSLLID